MCKIDKKISSLHENESLNILNFRVNVNGYRLIKSLQCFIMNCLTFYEHFKIRNIYSKFVSCDNNNFTA